MATYRQIYRKIMPAERLGGLAPARQLTLAFHHLWVKTISVSQGLTVDHTVAFIQMTLSGMAVDAL